VYKKYDLSDTTDVRVSIYAGNIVTRISNVHDLTEQRPMPPFPYKYNTWDNRKRKSTFIADSSPPEPKKQRVAKVSLIRIFN